jgi:hypothetical protein
MSSPGQKDRNWLSQQFRRDKVGTANDEELQEYIFILCNEKPPTDELQSRDIVRALTLNHARTHLFLDGLNGENVKIHGEIRDLTKKIRNLTIGVVILTVGTILLGLYPIIHDFYHPIKTSDHSQKIENKTN